MNASAEPVPDTNSTDGGDDKDLRHVICMECHLKKDGRSMALCGLDVTERPDLGDYTKPDKDTCVVCADLDPTHKCEDEEND